MDPSNVNSLYTGVSRYLRRDRARITTKTSSPHESRRSFTATAVQPISKRRRQRCRPFRRAADTATIAATTITRMPCHFRSFDASRRVHNESSAIKSVSAAAAITGRSFTDDFHGHGRKDARSVSDLTDATNRTVKQAADFASHHHVPGTHVRNFYPGENYIFFLLLYRKRSLRSVQFTITGRLRS